ncbi:hypothetical protein HBI79_092850 [Parastagonospora nodorum]|nr:hypothetical protein HBI79_092850 [Parastagonospora nodorum]
MVSNTFGKHQSAKHKQNHKIHTAQHHAPAIKHHTQHKCANTTQDYVGQQHKVKITVHPRKQVCNEILRAQSLKILHRTHRPAPRRNPYQRIDLSPHQPASRQTYFLLSENLRARMHYLKQKRMGFVDPASRLRSTAGWDQGLNGPKGEL